MGLELLDLALERLNTVIGDDAFHLLKVPVALFVHLQILQLFDFALKSLHILSTRMLGSHEVPLLLQLGLEHALAQLRRGELLLLAGEPPPQLLGFISAIRLERALAQLRRGELLLLAGEPPPQLLGFISAIRLGLGKSADKAVLTTEVVGHPAARGRSPGSLSPLPSQHRRSRGRRRSIRPRGGGVGHGGQLCLLSWRLGVQNEVRAQRSGGGGSGSGLLLECRRVVLLGIIGGRRQPSPTALGGRFRPAAGPRLCHLGCTAAVRAGTGTCARGGPCSRGGVRRARGGAAGGSRVGGIGGRCWGATARFLGEFEGVHVTPSSLDVRLARLNLHAVVGRVHASEHHPG
mmetsp:Transcript_99146/g.318101  ORF Transcript_99146/g.318101 Transcript_99146/m.318101 type:complete len:348 (-) Transcript_99146:150-1193(-)